jgi:hypothetical protein
MLKTGLLSLLFIYMMPSFAQKSNMYLDAPVELSSINFSTFNAADFYSKAGNTIYKKSVSGLADPSVFGYVYGTNAEGLADAAATFRGVKYYAVSMVVDKAGKLIGICASAAPASRHAINKRLKAMENQYGAPTANALKKQYVFAKGEKYVQVSLVEALNDYNKPIADTYTTRLYILDKAYVERIKEGVDSNEFAALKAN